MICFCITTTSKFVDFADGVQCLFETDGCSSNRNINNSVQLTLYITIIWHNITLAAVKYFQGTTFKYILFTIVLFISTFSAE